MPALTGGLPMRARCLAILLVGAIVGAVPAARAQHACDLVLDLPADHAVAPAFGPGAPSEEGPLVIAILSRHAELEAALCAPDVRRLIDGNALCVAIPSPAGLAPDAFTPALIAWRGRKPLALYWNEAWDGSVFLWVAGVVSGELDGVELFDPAELPRGSVGGMLGKAAGFVAMAELGDGNLDSFSAQGKHDAEAIARCLAVVSLFSSLREHERALVGARQVWDATRGSHVFLGVRSVYLGHMWSDLLAVDPDGTRAALQAELERSISDGDQHSKDMFIFKDIQLLCALLGQPGTFALQVRRHMEFDPAGRLAFALARDGGFDLLCGDGNFGAARLLIGPKLPAYLKDRLESLAEVGATADVREEVGRCCVRVALLGRDSSATGAVVAHLRESLGARGLAVAVKACMEAGPPDEFSKRWGRQLLADTQSATYLLPAERGAIETWLGG